MPRQQPEHYRMTIGEHLDELRWHVLRALGYVFVAAMVCFYFQDELMAIATRPHRMVAKKVIDETGVPGVGLDSELRDLVLAIRDEDEGLQGELEAALRDESKLRERVDPSLETLREIDGELAELKAGLSTLRAEQERLVDAEPAQIKEAMAALTKHREQLAARYVGLEQRIARQVTPFVDRRAKTPIPELVQLRYQEYFLSALKLTLVAALFLASPLAVRELWTFVSKGLYPHEQRYIKFFYPLSLGAFAAGMCFGYFILIPLGLEFLIKYGGDMVQGNIAVGDYLSLFTGMTLVVGLIFELPLVMTFLAMIGVMNATKYRAVRRFFLLAAFVVGAFLTPPDPVTQCLMALPLILLYELGIVLSVMFGAKQERAEESLPGGEPPAAPPPSAEAGTSTPAPLPLSSPSPLIAPAEAPTVARGASSPTARSDDDGPVPVLPMESDVGGLDSELGPVEPEAPPLTSAIGAPAEVLGEFDSEDEDDADDEPAPQSEVVGEFESDASDVQAPPAEDPPPAQTSTRFDPDAEDDDDEPDDVVISSAYRELVQRRAAEAAAKRGAPAAPSEGAAGAPPADAGGVDPPEEGADA